MSISANLLVRSLPLLRERESAQQPARETRQPPEIGISGAGPRLQPCFPDRSYSTFPEPPRKKVAVLRFCTFLCIDSCLRTTEQKSRKSRQNTLRAKQTSNKTQSAASRISSLRETPRPERQE